MTTIQVLHSKNGTYAVTVNGEVVAAGLTSAAAWREAERLVESGTAENANDRLGDANGRANRARYQ